ncbi:MAG: NADH-quinone oxidoreductase subunit M, partial [Nitrospinae bacterium]|nr:NADH-quinone oxidoreductase subunit M [Nitrospinota bacterium]
MFLTFLTFLPLIGAIFLAFIPKHEEDAIKQTALAIAVADFLLSLQLYADFDTTTAAMQFTMDVPWIEAWGISYHVGLDGISLLLYIMTTMLTAIAILASFGIKKHIKEFMMAMLALSTGMLGVFISLDFFLFYMFWEFQLIPMYLIIGVWGGQRRIYATIKFFLYTFAGSVLMLVAILAIRFTTGTFDITEIPAEMEGASLVLQRWVFVAFFFAFAIKVPMFPFHTWLPDAHVEAPTAVSVLLAGVLLKMGIYGLLRISFPIFPEATKFFAWPMAILGVVGIIYGAIVCMAQTDLKKLIAYSSISHMGYCLLGMAAVGSVAGLSGSIFQMVSHGLITGALFMLVGVIYDRTHSREIDGYGGLWLKVPVYS